MYEWLRDELGRIRWPGFHVIEPCHSPLDPTLPPSYLAFAREFGFAKLYRWNSRYQVGVYCPPELAELPEGDALLMGHCSSNEAYFKVSELAEGKEAPVYERIDGALENMAFDFASWLRTGANDAREEYGRDEWARLERGPEPFTSEEQAILDARRHVSWTFLGKGTDNALRFSVHNRSDRRLKAFTLGIKHKDGNVQGRFSIDTSDIDPGQTRIVEVEGYATLPSEDAVVFDLPEPTPAERDRYAELATHGPLKR
jgi:hypothetical protein